MGTRVTIVASNGKSGGEFHLEQLSQMEQESQLSQAVAAASLALNILAGNCQIADEADNQNR